MEKDYTEATKRKKYDKNRSPTIEEIQTLLEYPDRRIKVIILIMIYCGMRLGGWHDLPYNTYSQLIIQKTK